MGAALTPETLNQIKQKNMSKPSNKNKNNIDNSNEKIKKNKNNIYWNIFNNIYSPFYKKIKQKSRENENELILSTKLGEENNKNKNTGNEINDKILKESINTKGKIFFEIGFDEADAVKAILSENNFSDIKVYKDLAELDRVVMGTFQ